MLAKGALFLSQSWACWACSACECFTRLVLSEHEHGSEETTLSLCRKERSRRRCLGLVLTAGPHICPGKAALQQVAAGDARRVLHRVGKPRASPWVCSTSGEAVTETGASSRGREQQNRGSEKAGNSPFGARAGRWARRWAPCHFCPAAPDRGLRVHNAGIHWGASQALGMRSELVLQKNHLLLAENL